MNSSIIEQLKKLQANTGKTLVTLSVAAALSTTAATAFASGFQLFEGNGSNVTNYGAGGAAEANDASSAYYNPAGLTRLDHPQVLIGSTAIWPKFKFTGDITQSIGLAPNRFYTEHANAVPGDKFAFVPATSFAYPFHNGVVAGLNVSAPFGLSTNFGENTATRYAGTNTKLTTINITPVLAGRLSDKVSVGAGVDIQYARAEFNSMAGAPTLRPPALVNRIPANFRDTSSRNEGDDWGYGWHAGILIEFTPHTRVGLAYHSSVSHELLGTSVLSGPLNGLVARGISPNVDLISNNLQVNATFPAFSTISVYHDINDQWAVMGSVNYTQWDVFKEIRLQNVAGLDAAGNPSVDGTIVSSQNYRNTWRVAAGANYKVTHALTLKGGVGFDQTPTNNKDRDIRLPDGDRYAAAFGVQYHVTDDLSVTAGYTHLWVKNSTINKTSTTGSQTVTQVGRSNSGANLIGGEIAWNIPNLA